MQETDLERLYLPKRGRTLNQTTERTTPAITTRQIQWNRTNGADSKRRTGRFVLLALAASLGWIPNSEAQWSETDGVGSTINTVPAPAPGEPDMRVEDPMHLSLVMDYRHHIALWDYDFHRSLTHCVLSLTKGSADVVMQQCYGGGFANDLNPPQPWMPRITNLTFASAAAWYQPAVNAQVSFQPPGPIPPRNIWGLDNFTRAWRQHAVAQPAKGMRDHLRAAASGLDGVLSDPYAPPGVTNIIVWTNKVTGVLTTNITVNTDFAQYRSTDSEAGGPNNQRTFDSPSNTFAVLVGWSDMRDQLGVEEPRFQVNVARIYTMLQGFGIGTSRVTLLFANRTTDAAGTNRIANFPLINAGTTNQFTMHGGRLPPTAPLISATVDAALTNTADPTGWFIDGRNDLRSWYAALRGEYFTKRKPRAGDRLFIYFTGHGAEVWRILVPNPRKVGPKEVVRYAVKKGDKGGFQVGQEGQIVLDAGPGLGMSELLFGVDQDSDQNALVQLVSREPLAATVALLINGTNVGNFGLDIPLVTNPDQQYELPALGFDPGANPSHYQIRVPLDLLDIPSGEPDRIHFELEGSPGFLTNNEVLGIFLRGGEQNVWTVAAPAPPSFSSVARMTNGIRLRLQGPPQSTYIVEHSPMIPATSWSPLSTNVITGSSVDVLDPASGLQQRFYRARLTDGVVPSVLSGSHCTLTPVAGPGGTLTAADLHGTVMPSGRIVVARGTNQTFNALPDTNHVVSDWHVDGQLVQTNGTSFTLTNIQAFHFLSVDFLPTTDVAVAKEASAEVVLTNSLLTFTVSVENRGGSALTGVTVTDPLPPNVEFVAATSDVGSCTNSNGTVTCDVGSLLPGAAATITIQVTSTVPGFLTNSATVTALEADVVPENNSSTTIVQVVPPP